MSVSTFLVLTIPFAIQIFVIYKLIRHSDVYKASSEISGYKVVQGIWVSYSQELSSYCIHLYECHDGRIIMGSQSKSPRVLRH